jgi:ribosomal protein S18 acetylase RimI-like enzyme
MASTLLPAGGRRPRRNRAPAPARKLLHAVAKTRHPMTTLITPERPDTPEAMALIAELEAQLATFYPVESRHGFSVERLLAESVAFCVLRVDGQPAGCGGIKLFGRDYGELKRMYVRPQFRGAGFGQMLIDHLAAHARANGVRRLRLETGIHQAAAIKLYESAGFRRIPPFPPYQPDPLSLCFEKLLAPA